MSAAAAADRAPYAAPHHAVVDGWLDLAKLVASEGSKSKGPYEELAYRIGKGQWQGSPRGGGGDPNSHMSGVQDRAGWPRK